MRVGKITSVDALASPTWGMRRIGYMDCPFINPSYSFLQ